MAWRNAKTGTNLKIFQKVTVGGKSKGGSTQAFSSVVNLCQNRTYGQGPQLAIFFVEFGTTVAPLKSVVSRILGRLRTESIQTINGGSEGT